MIILNSFQLFCVTVALLIGLIRYSCESLELKTPRWVEMSMGPAICLAFGSLFATYYNMIF